MKYLTIALAITTVVFAYLWLSKPVEVQSLGEGVEVVVEEKPADYYTAKTESLGGVSLTKAEYDLEVGELKVKLEYSMTAKEEPFVEPVSTFETKETVDEKGEVVTEVIEIKPEVKLPPEDKGLLTNDEFEKVLEVANKKCQNLKDVKGNVLVAILNCL